MSSELSEQGRSDLQASHIAVGVPWNARSNAGLPGTLHTTCIRIPRRFAAAGTTSEEPNPSPPSRGATDDDEEDRGECLRAGTADRNKHRVGGGTPFQLIREQCKLTLSHYT